MIVPLRLCRERIALGRGAELLTIVKKCLVEVLMVLVKALVKTIRQNWVVAGEITAIAQVISGGQEERTVGIMRTNPLVLILLVALGERAPKKIVLVIILRVAAQQLKT